MAVLPSALRGETPRRLDNRSRPPRWRDRDRRSSKRATACAPARLGRREDLVYELAVATEVVVRAVGLCQSIAGDADAMAAFAKEDLTPVTVADYAIQALVEDELTAAGLLTREVPLIAEESWSQFDRDSVRDLVDPFRGAAASAGSSLEAQAAGGDRWWVLDPIDGTRGFVSGDETDMYTIGLALIQDGAPIVGVLGLPNYPNWDLAKEGTQQHGGLVLTSARGRGTTLVGAGGRGAADMASTSSSISSSSSSSSVVDGSATFEDATVLVSRSQASFCARVPLARAFAGRRPRQVVTACCGSLCKYAAVALGLASCYVEHPVEGKDALRTWDHAAGVSTVLEAGGKVTDLVGNDLVFERGESFTPGGLGVVCSNGVFHDEIVSRLSKELGLR